MTIKLTEMADVSLGLEAQDLETGKDTPNGHWVKMDKHRQVAAILVSEKAATDPPGDVTLKLQQAKDADGDAAKDLAEVKLESTTADDAVYLTVEADVADMDFANDFYYVGVHAESADNDLVAGAVIVRFKSRYMDEEDKGAIVDLS